jgi:hypothetical protein
MNGSETGDVKLQSESESDLASERKKKEKAQRCEVARPGFLKN